MKERIKEKWHKKHIGVRPRLFLALAALTLLSMVVLWVFQIRLLGYFYERERFSEIKELASNLSNVVGQESFASQVQTSAEGHSTCICVFRIEHDPVDQDKRIAVQVADAEGNNDCMLHHMPGDQLSKIYDHVKENGGVYDRRLELKKNFDGSEENFRVPGFHHRGTSINAIHARLLTVGNEEYLMILDTQLTPVDAVVKTLEVQFSWIMIAMLIAAFLVAFLTSRMIARPLTAIT